MRIKREGVLRQIHLGAVAILAVALLAIWWLDAPSLSTHTVVAFSALVAAGYYGMTAAAIVVAIFALPAAALKVLAGASPVDWGILMAQTMAMVAGAYIVQHLTVYVWRELRSARARQEILRRELRSLRRVMAASEGIAAAFGGTREVLDCALHYIMMLPNAVGAAWVRDEECGTTEQWPMQLLAHISERRQESPTWAFYSAPLNVLVVDFRAGDAGSGRLAVAIRGPRRRYRATFRTLEYIAGTLTTALVKSRALEVQRTQTSYLKLLNELGRRFAANLSLEDLFDAMYVETSRVVDAGAFFVALYHEERQEVEMRYAYDNGGRQPPVTFALNQGPTSRAIRDRVPILYNRDSRSIPGVQLYGNPERVVESVLVVPIMLQDQVIGAMSAQSYQVDAFTEEHVQLLSTIANQAAIALDNAQLYERTLTLALTDSMTGLANARSFHQAVTKVVAEASERSTPVSLLYIDSDCLKQVNDRFGHLAGDEHICALGATIRDSVRAGDTVARYGGDEFVVLLPNTGSEEARAIALRVLQAVRQLEHRMGVAAIRATASAGVATYPQHAASAEELIRAADVAMYRAKQAGKDRVYCPGDETGNAVGA